MSNLEKMTVVQLREYAIENSIDVSEAKTKSSILSAILNTNAKVSTVDEQEINKVISYENASPKKRNPVSNTRPDENNVVTVASANTFKKNKDSSSVKISMVEKVAVYSEKNMNWSAIGKVSKGYNIVTKEAAEMWLTRKGIRKATPEEVATHYGL